MSLENKIAIVGMACRFPDAAAPDELWKNVLSQRRAFRRFPRERLDLESYHSEDPSALDSTYVSNGAFLEDYEFDRVQFRISGATYRSADPVHWLALDVANSALSDAGFADGNGLPKETTGVFLGNTLTGEFSRAAVLRQRWPYVQRVLAKVLGDRSWNTDAVSELLAKLEPEYKRPFAVPGAESLVGGLANTIAGRICNYFDLKGGGYIVDGACSSSLLAVVQACSALMSQDVDVALAGGVDLSMDPFELVGFARTGAIAKDTMRVFDQSPTGFLPGEGCAFVVLRRYRDAVAAGQRVYGVVRGWGISSDGAGGMTRPEMEGQQLALQRAYRRAGFGIGDVAYFEAHGTGTEIGDEVELKTLNAERRAGGAAQPALVGSIKANIGHTKAAAGIAGLIKSTMAVWHAVLPPTTGCETPHAEVNDQEKAMRVSKSPAAWQSRTPRRAGVSSFGFGGINAHVVVEEADEQPHRATVLYSLDQFFTPDCELFLLGGSTAAELLETVNRVFERAPELSIAELTDLAATLERQSGKPFRAAIVASSPIELRAHLETLRKLLQEGTAQYVDTNNSVFLGRTQEGRDIRIGYLFPGQAAPVRRDAGALGRHFAACRRVYEKFTVPPGSDDDTAVAQPAIMAASFAALTALDALGLNAEFALGHSIGEVAALCWAGALSENAALGVAIERGRAMAAAPEGSMASIAAGIDDVAELCRATDLEIAAFNSPRQIVVSGRSQDVHRAIEMARLRGWRAILLPVTRAFHSRLMREASVVLRGYLSDCNIGQVRRRVFSTITGSTLNRDAEVRELLVRQVTHPVEFRQALERAVASGVDLLIEVGPGSILTGLNRDSVPIPAVSIDACSESHRGLFTVAAAAFVMGAPIRTGKLFERYTKPFDLAKRKRFLANPCEAVAPLAPGQRSQRLPVPTPLNGALGSTHSDPDDAIAVVRRLVAQTTELPLTKIQNSDKLAEDLRLNSITVAELAANAAQALNRPPLLIPTNFSNASIEQLAQALMQEPAPNRTRESPEPLGRSSWVRCFVTELVPEQLGLISPTQTGAFDWTLHIAQDHPLRDAMRTAFSGEGEGVVLCLSPDDNGQEFLTILEIVRHLPANSRFVLIHHGTSYSAFIRSIHFERPDLTIRVVRIPAVVEFCKTALIEANLAEGFGEVWYGEDGVRKTPSIRLSPVAVNEQLPLSEQDVILISGGAKGIGAECALYLGRQSKARLILVGRSALAADAEASQNAARLSEAGVAFVYVQCDISHRASLKAALAETQAAVGKVTVIIHAAGRNSPRPLASLTTEDIATTMSPKVDGLNNLIAAVAHTALRMCICFGSIIGRMGMRGDADYALANELMRARTEELSARMPHCRFLTLEWSLWSGVGMAARLGAVETFARQGFSAISPDQGTRMLARVLSTEGLSGSIIIAADFSRLPCLPLSGANPPLLRFLERILKFIPEIELIAEASLSIDTDPYLGDHRMKQSIVFPAVMGIEAMAQAAAALGLDLTKAGASDLHFEQPIFASESRPTRIRVYALREMDDRVHTSIRSAESDFQVDHFRCTFRSIAKQSPVLLEPGHVGKNSLPAHSSDDVYETILFQSGRFQRIHAYEALSARSCRARITAADSSWFASYMPSTLVWGDPGVHDAAMHAIQACVPTHTIIPLTIEEIIRESDAITGEFLVNACERAHSGRTFTYDIDVTCTDGRQLEQWRGVVFTQVEAIPESRYFESDLLIGPYFERRAYELFSARQLHISLKLDWSPQHDESDRFLSQAAGCGSRILRRTDGKPEVLSSEDRYQYISATHTDALSIGIAADIPIGCDAEMVQHRSDTSWASLLGKDRFDECKYLSSRKSQDFDSLATRFWCIKEAFIKTGFEERGLLRLVGESPDGWIEFECGNSSIFSWCAHLRTGQIAIAIVAARETTDIYLSGTEAISLQESPI